jgi:hypothetical protein
MSSGRYIVPISPFEGLAKIASSITGEYLTSKADKEEATLSEKKRKDFSDYMREVARAQQPDELQPATVGVEYKPESMTSDELQRAGDAHADYKESVSDAQAAVDANDRARQQAAYMRGFDLGGPAADIAGVMAQRDLLPPVAQPYSLSPGEVRFDGSNKPIAQGVPKQATPLAEDRQLINVVDPQSPGGYKTIRRADFTEGMQEWQKPSAADGSGTELLDEQTLDLAAREVIQDQNNMRTYATFGKAGQALRMQINKEVAQKLKDAGMTASDLAQARAKAKSSIKSQDTLVKSLNAVESFEKLAKFNGQRILELIDEVDETGVPVLEGFIRAAKRKGMADVDATELQSVLMTYQTEVARIITQPNLTGQLTDTARQEVQHMISGDMSAPQLRRLINRLDLEMSMRGKYIRDQIGNVNTDIAVMPNAPPVSKLPSGQQTDLPKTNAKGWVLHEDPDGNLAYVGPKGEVEEVP